MTGEERSLPGPVLRIDRREPRRVDQDALPDPRGCEPVGRRQRLHELVAMSGVRRRRHDRPTHQAAGKWKPPDYNRIIGDDPGWEPSTATRPLPVESLPREKELAALSTKLLERFAQPLEYLVTERGIDPQTMNGSRSDIDCASRTASTCCRCVTTARW